MRGEEEGQRRECEESEGKGKWERQGQGDGGEVLEG